MQTLKYIGQFLLLWIIYLLSAHFVAWTNLPVPASVVGVIVLFILLSAGIVKPAWVENVADFLLKHFIFFFIPITVGLMDWGGVFYDYGPALLAAVVISSALPLLTVGFLTVLLHKE